jgi:hypothetical protein
MVGLLATKGAASVMAWVFGKPAMLLFVKEGLCYHHPEAAVPCRGLDPNVQEAVLEVQHRCVGMQLQAMSELSVTWAEKSAV